MKTKTDLIFELTNPYNNPYQGNDSRLLFVCSVGLLRSPTAANVAIKLGYNARSCGSDHELSLIPISVNLIYWAHSIFFLNQENYKETLNNFLGDKYTLEELNSKYVIWDIPDNYEYNHPELIELITNLLVDDNE